MVKPTEDFYYKAHKSTRINNRFDTLFKQHGAVLEEMKKITARRYGSEKLTVKQKAMLDKKYKQLDAKGKSLIRQMEKVQAEFNRHLKKIGDK